ncbi:MAG: DUF3578 domain-containing protein [Candidatus Schmidhempelia sp.]|nr:DUF3578 domain-containing protein [Candidatus Schmidhempelia sp.]
MNLHDVLKEIMTNYIKESTENPFKGNSLAKNIRSNFKNCFNENHSISENKDFFIKGSAGQSQWAKIPWLGIFNKKIAKGPKQGFYLVYLFSEDMEKVYLSLNQGYTYFQTEYKKYALRNIQMVSAYFQKELLKNKKSKLLEHIDLRKNQSNHTLGKGYEKGNIFAIEYQVSSLPDNEELVTDLSEMISIYKKLNDLIEDGIKDDSVVNEIVENILENRNTSVGRQEQYPDKYLTKNIDNLVDSAEKEMQKNGVSLKEVDIEKLKASTTKKAKKDVSLKPKRKRDYIAEAARNSKIGSLGEKMVLEDEKSRLKKNKNKVVHVSETDDSKGYDIESVDNNGNPIYIEVKATTGPWDTPFYISQNEIDVSKMKGKQYVLKRLYNIKKSKADFYEIRGPLEDSEKIDLEVVNYIAKLK